MLLRLDRSSHIAHITFADKPAILTAAIKLKELHESFCFEATAVISQRVKTSVLKNPPGKQPFRGIIESSSEEEDAQQTAKPTKQQPQTKPTDKRAPAQPCDTCGRMWCKKTRCRLMKMAEMGEDGVGN